MLCLHCTCKHVTAGHMYNVLQIDAGNVINSPVEVKISGDGAPFSRSSSYVLLSFSLPTLDVQSLSGAGKVHT